MTHPRLASVPVTEPARHPGGGRRPSIDELRIDRDRLPRRSARWLVALVAVLALAALAAWLWGARGAAAEVVVAPVRVEAGGPAGAAAVLDASGYVTARRRSTISSKVTGQVEEVYVEEGMRVEAGQPLARLDASQTRARLALAEAQLAAARRALAETEVRLAESRVDLRRAESLFESGVQTRAAVDAAKAEVDSLAARLELGRQEVEVAARTVGVERQFLSDLVIRAPFSGIVVSKDAQPGEMISPVSAGGGFTRTGICTLVDMGSLEIEVDVNESFIHRVEPDQRVVAVLDAYPDWRIPGHVITTVPTADRQKATVKVRIAFDQIDERVLPEMGVKVSFLEERPAAADGAAPARRLLVPREALRGLGENGGAHVFVVADGRAVRRAVRPGEVRGEEVEVEGGLAAGERVVVRGPAELEDGQRVDVVERDAA